MSAPPAHSVTASAATTGRPRVVVVGAGFGGLAAVPDDERDAEPGAMQVRNITHP